MATKPKPKPAEPKPAERVTSLRMPSDIRSRAKVWAAKNDTSLQAVVVSALEEYLKKRGA